MMKHSTNSMLEKLTYFGAAAGVFFLWTVFETQVIEPYGLNAFLPFYRVDGICVWDILAIAVITLVFRSAILCQERSRS